MPGAQLALGEDIIARIVPKVRELMQGSNMLGLSEATRLQLTAGAAHALLTVAVIGPVSRTFRARAAVTAGGGEAQTSAAVPTGPSGLPGQSSGVWPAPGTGLPGDEEHHGSVAAGHTEPEGATEIAPFEDTRVESGLGDPVAEVAPADTPVEGRVGDPVAEVAPADSPVGRAPADTPVGGESVDTPVGGAPGGRPGNEPFAVANAERRERGWPGQVAHVVAERFGLDAEEDGGDQAVEE
jgi:hypothetical protein